jgi:hypothetical protein
MQGGIGEQGREKMRRERWVYIYYPIHAIMLSDPGAAVLVEQVNLVDALTRFGSGIITWP